MRDFENLSEIAFTKLFNNLKVIYPQTLLVLCKILTRQLLTLTLQFVIFPVNFLTFD